MHARTMTIHASVKPGPSCSCWQNPTATDSSLKRIPKPQDPQANPAFFLLSEPPNLVFRISRLLSGSAVMLSDSCVLSDSAVLRFGLSDSAGLVGFSVDRSSPGHLCSLSFEAETRSILLMPKTLHDHISRRTAHFPQSFSFNVASPWGYAGSWAFAQALVLTPASMQYESRGAVGLFKVMQDFRHQPYHASFCKHPSSFISCFASPLGPWQHGKRGHQQRHSVARSPRTAACPTMPCLPQSATATSVALSLFLFMLLLLVAFPSRTMFGLGWSRFLALFFLLSDCVRLALRRVSRLSYQHSWCCHRMQPSPVLESEVSQKPRLRADHHAWTGAHLAMTSLFQPAMTERRPVSKRTTTSAPFLPVWRGSSVPVKCSRQETHSNKISQTFQVCTLFRMRQQSRATQPAQESFGPSCC